MSLNDPNAQKKQQQQQSFQEQPPVSRSIISAYTNRRSVSISRQSKYMAFNLNSDSDGQYVRKIKNFLDFLFKINYSNSIYVSLDLSKPEETIAPSKYKVYVGKGNNSLLVKSLIKRRFWWEIVDSLECSGINFYWTQNIVDKIEAKQQRASRLNVVSSKLFQKRREVDDSLDLNRKILSPEKAKKV